MRSSKQSTKRMSIQLLKSEVSERTHRCYVGMAVGALLGSQRQGATGYVAVAGYNPVPPMMRPLAELDLQVLWLETVRDHGAPQTAFHLAEVYRDRYARDAEPFALWNLRQGLLPPATGSSENPWGEQFTAAARSQLWACLAPGWPAEAARLAGLAASVDHYGEAAYAAMFIAAVQSGAFVGLTIPKLIGIGLRMIPFDSVTANCVRAAVNAVQTGASGEEARSRLLSAAGANDPDFAPCNVATLVYALLTGNGDFSKTVCTAASMGGAAQQVTGAAGSVAAILGWTIGEDWLHPVADGFASNVDGAPKKLTKWAKSVNAAAMKLKSKDAPVKYLTELPAPVPPIAPIEGEELVAVAPAPDPGDVLGDNSRSCSLWSSPQYSQVTVCGSIRVTFDFQEPPYVRPGHSNRLRIVVENLGDDEVAVEPKLSAPDGWAIAFRASPAHMRPGTQYEFAAVVQCPSNSMPQEVNRLVLSCGVHQIETVLLKRRGWLSVGAFRNDEGTGFDKPYRPEDVWKRDEVFMLRSNVPGKWKEAYFDGSWMPIEDDFGGMPGVMYYRTILRSGLARKVKMVAATDDGIIVFVNRKRSFWYHDHTAAVPLLRKPYLAELELAEGDNELMLKVARCLQPIRGLWFFVLGEDGQIPQDLWFDETKA